MSVHATQATQQGDPGPHAADMPNHRQVLNEPVDMGAGLARLLHAQAFAQAALQPTDAHPTPNTNPQKC